LKSEKCASFAWERLVVKIPDVYNDEVPLTYGEAVMNRCHSLSWVFGLLTILGLASAGTPQQPAPAAQDNIALQNPIEVLTRGPLHEAFAQPFDVKPEPGKLIPKEPPPPVPEEPPEQKPQADNVQWIPGYWAWDGQRQEFMWVSGVYRVPPQDRTFIPGYWQHTTDGWRWVPGFWSDAKQQELPYTPEPPAPLEGGPSLPRPDDNSAYVPGAWIYRDGRFVWRPGYYAAIQPGRVWMPPRYLWTPSGYLFVDGYWDYPLEDRGLAFAPVSFRRPLWLDAGWRYQPSMVLGLDTFFDSCFVNGGSFYFGDFYNPLYARLGYNPWFAGRGRFDPVFSHHAWRNHRNDPNWIAGVQHTFASRTAGRVAAPAIAVTPLNQVRQVKLVQATPTQLQTQRTFGQQARQLAVNRQQLDAAFVNKGGSARTFENRSFRLPTGANQPAKVLTASSSNLRITTALPITTAPTPRVVTQPAPLRAAPLPAAVYRRTVSTVNPTARITTNAAPVTNRNVATRSYPPRLTATTAARPQVSAAARAINRAPARTSGGSSRPAGRRR
jgi:hypothetical protein